MARLVFLPRLPIYPVMNQVRIDVQEHHFAPHDPVRPPSKKYVEFNPSSLMATPIHDTFQDAALWFGMSQYHAWMTIQEFDITNRFWDRNDINVYLETVPGTVLISRQDDNTWRLQFSDNKTGGEFLVWFHGQNKGSAVELTLKTDEQFTQMREWMAQQLVGRHEVARTNRGYDIAVRATIERPEEATAFKLRWYNLPKEEDEDA